MRRAVLALALALASTPGASHAKPARAGAQAPAPPAVRAVSRPRVTLGDLIPDLTAELAAVDLGPSPAPGGTRLIKRDEIEQVLPQGARVKLPEAVRVERKAHKLAPLELETLAKDAAEKVGLPRGVTVVAFRPKASVTIPAGHDGVRFELPKPPRREGKLTTNATLVFSQGESELARVTVPVELKLGPEAAQPDVKKGSKVVLVVRRGLIEIHATATANHDADVGDALAVTISESGKVLRGKLDKDTPPTVTEEQP